jgi:hypothetical protein
MQVLEPSGSASDYVTDADLTREINASGRLWHAKVVQAIPERYEAQQTVTPTGVSTYSLPADYYRTLGVSYLRDNGEPLPLPRIQYQERWRYTHSSAVSQSLVYYLTSTNIALLPKPASGGNTYAHDYVKAWTALSGSSDAVDGFSGWEQWIVFDVAIKLRFKEESMTREWIGQRDFLEAQIRDMAKGREASNPMRVQDTRLGKWGARGLVGRYNPDFWGSR